MPLIDTDFDTALAPRLRVEVHGSIAVELEWALAAGNHHDFRQDHPTLAAAYAENPDLHARVQAIWADLWPDMATTCFMELMVLAERGGHLLSLDADAFLDDLPRLCTETFDAADYPMVSETAEDRRVILRRLELLRESAELRARYVALVRDVWEAVRGDWERFGRGAVAQEVDARRSALARGTDWHEVARGSCDFGDLLNASVAGLRPDDALVVVPAFLTHHGLLLDLPGTVVSGVRTDTTGVEARARTEVLARRLKAISDPTRLAILDALRQGPRTVTQLAAAFALAQPTVSNHVRVLREGGLVSDVRDGTRRNLVVRPDAVDALMAGLTSVLVTSSASRAPS